MTMSIVVSRQCNHRVRSLPAVVSMVVMVVTAAVSAAPAQASRMFNAPFIPFGIAPGANDIALADLENDGRLDIIVAGASGVSSGQMSIALSWYSRPRVGRVANP